ncbi:MAG: tetratricopeptide repeat protein [Candidatus Binataceae bacterium]
MMGVGWGGTFTTRAAARILAVPPERIRYWIRRRLISPAMKRGRNFRFAFNDLLVMRLAKDLLPKRHHIDPVRRCIARAQEIAAPDRPVSSLRLSNLDGRIVIRDGRAAFEVDTGQMLIDFEPERPPAAVDDRFGPARARERFDEARRIAEEDPLKALSVYSALIGREPQNFEGHLRLAALLDSEGDLSGSLRHLLGAAAIAPANADVHFKLGLLYRQRSEPDHAIRSFHRAIECDPTHVEAHRNLADLYNDAGRKRDAQKHLTAIHRLIRGD